MQHPERVSIPKDVFRDLLRDFYQADKTAISEFSGNISGDWLLLADRVDKLSRMWLGEDFDFGDDDWIYGRK